MSARPTGFDTRAVHAGKPRPGISGAVVTPVFHSTTYDSVGGEDYHAIRYSRLSNSPNHLELAGRLAALEGGEAALGTASGMAAISTALLSLLGSGDHLIAQAGLYGGTHDLLTRHFPSLGIAFDFADGNRPESWEALLRPRTRVFYLETLTNPLLEVADLEAAVRFARAHGLVTVIDNTFASPFNFRPLEHGFDLCLHSATKFLNGHHDVVAGALVGRAELVERARICLDHFGAALDPAACALLCRGIKTLAVRLRHQNASALRIARFLEARPEVSGVHHPGLDSHPQVERARRLLDGTGGMLAFELRAGAPAAERLVASLELVHAAPSLGGVESLVSLPARSSHAGLSPEERHALGIGDGLVRLSVGLESPEDLEADLVQALEAAVSP
jgi:cystathionine beta-lyase/cystathionine gamma-synthase